MTDRLDIVGGRLAIASSPGNGTTLSGHVPLDRSVDDSNSAATTRAVTTDATTTDEDQPRSIPAQLASTDTPLDVTTA